MTLGRSAVLFGFFVLVTGAIITCSRRSTSPPPEPVSILSEDTLYVAGGIRTSYQAVASSPGSDNIIFGLVSHPDWLQLDADSIFGIPPDPIRDTQFTIIAADAQSTDTLTVEVLAVPNVVVFGDTRSGHDAHRRIVQLIRQRDPLAVFHVGDLVNNGNLAADWDSFNAIEQALMNETRYYPALGNHEYHSLRFFDNFVLPNNEEWYSVDINRAHFIVLNSCADLSLFSAQYQWLLEDLAALDDLSQPIVLVFHHPMYTSGAHTEDEKGLRDVLIPILDQYRIDIVFTGHDHNYERLYCEGTYHIVTGGGGAPLRDQARSTACSQLYLKTYHYCRLSLLPEQFVVTVFDDSDRMVDQFEL